MKWADWDYSTAQYKYGPEITQLQAKRASGQLTRLEYKGAEENC